MWWGWGGGGGVVIHWHRLPQDEGSGPPAGPLWLPAADPSHNVGPGRHLRPDESRGPALPPAHTFIGTVV